MENKELIFWSIGCAKCGGLQLGGYEHDETHMETIAVFKSEILAQLSLSDGWQTLEDAMAHPPQIVQIKVTIMPPTLKAIPHETQ